MPLFCPCANECRRIYCNPSGTTKDRDFLASKMQVETARRDPVLAASEREGEGGPPGSVMMKRKVKAEHSTEMRANYSSQESAQKTFHFSRAA